MRYTLPRACLPKIAMRVVAHWPFISVHTLSDEYVDGQPTGKIVVAALEAPITRAFTMNDKEYAVRDYDRQKFIYLDDEMITDHDTIIAAIRKILDGDIPSEYVNIPSKLNLHLFWLLRAKNGEPGIYTA